MKLIYQRKTKDVYSLEDGDYWRTKQMFIIG